MASTMVAYRSNDTCALDNTFEMVDSDSDGDLHLGSFSPIQRRLNRRTRARNAGLKPVFIYHPETVRPGGLGDLDALISFLREKGVLPNLPPLFTTPAEHNVKKKSAAPVVPSKHQSLPSNASDSTATSNTISPDYVTPQTSSDEIDAKIDAIIQAYKPRCISKEVRWTGSVAGGQDSEEEREDQNTFAPPYNTRKSSIAQRSSRYSYLIPSSVIVPPPIENIKLDRFVIHPKYTLTLDETQLKLIKKLSQKFPDEPDIHRYPISITSLDGNKSEEGIHIFVDLSNIIIGFYNQLKLDRGMRKTDHIKQPPLAFSSLAIVLERGRKVARRVLAGSTITKEGSLPTTPLYIREALDCGYEPNILERVRKPKEFRKYAHRHKRTTGTGGYSSASDSTGAITYANTEQAVDEILHLKMMESIVDNREPSTMVVASGDAAQAEYSGGFLQMIIRALKHGWKVEVVSWKENISHEYTSSSFLKSWKDQFKIIHLDDYCEEMLAIYTDKFKMMV